MTIEQERKCAIEALSRASDVTQRLMFREGATWMDAEHAAALAKSEEDAHVLVCQAVTLLNNGETLKASQLLRQWLMDWDVTRAALEGK